MVHARMKENFGRPVAVNKSLHVQRDPKKFSADSFHRCRYLIGFQRYEENGVGLGHTQVIWENSADAWYPVEIAGRLFMVPQNIHGGLYVLSQEELKVSWLSTCLVAWLAEPRH